MTGFENLCMNCMSENGSKVECPVCGYRNDRRQPAHALPLKTVLQNRYIVGRAKRSNGEGITYIGYDTVLNVPVELREFFPQSFCERAADGLSIRVQSGSEIIFDECLTSFLNYSREVAHLRELSPLQQLYDIFEENHTAYTVAEWQECIPLRHFVERSGGNLPWNTVRPLFMPVLSALSSMHQAGVSHLGISPDTLLITKDGKMRLSSFCIAAVRKMDTDLPPDLVPGCAAIEQYVMGFAPNEATDVYGFAASLFFALTGALPQDALRRRTDSRLLIPTSVVRSIPSHVVTALANALQVSPEKRTATFERLRAELSAAPTVTSSIQVPSNSPTVSAHSYPVSQAPESAKKGAPAFVWVLGPCLAVIAVFAVVAGIWFFSNQPESLVPESAAPSAAGSASSQEVSAGGTDSSQEPSSQPADQIAAPKLVGEVYEKAVQDAESSGQYQVIMRAKKEFHDTVEEGSIISQDPKEGEMIRKGATIVVTVSRGKSMRKLPAVAGKPLAEASVVVSNEGFTVSKVEEYNDSVEMGVVIGYQNANEGDELAYGSPVVLVVSLGKQPS